MQLHPRVATRDVLCFTVVATPPRLATQDVFKFAPVATPPPIRNSRCCCVSPKLQLRPRVATQAWCTFCSCPSCNSSFKSQFSWGEDGGGSVFFFLFSWVFAIRPLTCYSPTLDLQLKGLHLLYSIQPVATPSPSHNSRCFVFVPVATPTPGSQLAILVVFHISCNSAHESQLDRGVLFVVAPVATEASSRNSGGDGGGLLLFCFLLTSFLLMTIPLLNMEFTPRFSSGQFFCW